MATPAMSQPATASLMNAGKPVTGNATGAFNSTTGGGANAALVTNMPGTQNPAASGTATGTGVGATNPVMAGAVPTVGNITDGTGSNGQQQAQLDSKQLTDIYGKGIGGLINNQINTQSGVASSADNTVLGSTTSAINSTGATLATDLSGSGLNSGIMQNYDASMAPTIAQNQQNLSTQLANSGVGANSSTTALAQADLTAQTQAQQSGVAAQLTSTQLADTLALNQSDTSTLANMGSNANSSVNGLLTNSQQAASKEVSSSGWNILGDVLNSAGTVGAQVYDSYSSNN